MLVTKRAVTTDEGIKLQLLNLSGAQLEFTKLEVGSGQYSQEEATEEALRKRTSLKFKKQQFGISGMDISNDETTLILSSMITNADLKEGYTIRELGLYARIKDQPDTECMVSVSLAEIEDEIPPYNGEAESRILMKYQFAVSDSDTVSLSYEHDPVALVEDVDAKVSNLLKKTKDLQKELENVQSELLGMVKTTAIVNNNTTTESGFALDARQANPTIEGTMAASIAQLNNDLIQITDDNFYKAKAAVEISGLFAHISAHDGTGNVTRLQINPVQKGIMRTVYSSDFGQNWCAFEIGTSNHGILGAYIESLDSGYIIRVRKAGNITYDLHVAENELSLYKTTDGTVWKKVWHVNINK